MKPVSVSQLNKYVGRILATDPILGNVSVKGEISNLKYHSGGHVYFNLKDSASTLRCFMPESYAEHLRYELEDGMEITASGYINVYEKGGYYSLTVKLVDLEGEGNLNAAFMALKRKLEMEGLFDPAHKKPLPVFTKCVGVVTASTGAAVRDIIRTIRNRNKVADILIFPCLVQGEGAAADIARCIDLANSRYADRIDVLIAGRGGGSAEDLWAFNEEIVARSIYNSKIPVISAVGHETDFSIADFTADYRAATPTAAASAAVPDTFALSELIDDMAEEIRRNCRAAIDFASQRLASISPDEISYHLKFRIKESLTAADRCIADIRQNMGHMLETLGSELEKFKVVLELSNPKNILERGYAAVADENGRIVSGAGGIYSGDSLTVYFNDGSLNCIVRNPAPENFEEYMAGGAESEK